MTSTPPPRVFDESAQKLMAELWQRNLPQTMERLRLLDQAASAAATASLTPELCTEASNIAHKLAGSLGMFGFNEGTQLARALEQQLESPVPDPAILSALATQLRQSIFPID